MTKGTRTPGDNLRARVQGWIQRIETLEQDIRDLNADKSQVYKEAKAAGFDPAHVRDAIRYRRDPQAAQERNKGTLEVLRLLGMDVGDTVPSPAALPAPDANPAGGALDTALSRAHARVHAHEDGGQPA